SNVTTITANYCDSRISPLNFTSVTPFNSSFTIDSNNNTHLIYTDTLINTYYITQNPLGSYLSVNSITNYYPTIIDNAYRYQVTLHPNDYVILYSMSNPVGECHLPATVTIALVQ